MVDIIIKLFGDVRYDEESFNRAATELLSSSVAPKMILNEIKSGDKRLYSFAGHIINLNTEYVTVRVDETVHPYLEGMNNAGSIKAAVEISGIVTDRIRYVNKIISMRIVGIIPELKSPIGHIKNREV